MLATRKPFYEQRRSTIGKEASRLFGTFLRTVGSMVRPATLTSTVECGGS
ncbi:hypothetical protein MUO56_04875 [Candidatus Bathyarchaeota archaeon]|nr:hypothetical protein [Candidatus Bathyarchaeota archaeon]